MNISYEDQIEKKEPPRCNTSKYPCFKKADCQCREEIDEDVDEDSEEIDYSFLDTEERRFCKGCDRTHPFSDFHAGKIRFCFRSFKRKGLV